MYKAYDDDRFIYNSFHIICDDNTTDFPPKQHIYIYVCIYEFTYLDYYYYYYLHVFITLFIYYCLLGTSE